MTEAAAVGDLRTIRDVELVKVGTWATTSGEWIVTADDLAAAVEAHAAGILRKPVVKLGHVGPMRDAAPALGYVDNLRVTAAGGTLIGDLVNVPRALAAILPTGYPDRSVEGLIDYEAPGGRVWPLVLTGLALLGATAPGVDTLRSLQDVADLYEAGEVAASRRVVLAAATLHPDDEPATRRRAVKVAAARRRRNHRTIGAS